MAKVTSLIRANNARHMVITPIARVSFPQVFTPRSFQDTADGKKTFSVDLLFDSLDILKEPYKGKKTQTPSVLQAVNNVKQDQWGSDKSRWPKFNYPAIKKGDDNTNRDGEVYAGYKGKIYLTAKCDEKFPPKVLGKDGKPLTEQEFYGGCYARAQLIVRPYAFGANFGIRFVLRSLLKEKDGEKFGLSEDVFDLAEYDEDSAWDTDTTAKAEAMVDSSDDDEDDWN